MIKECEINGNNLKIFYSTILPMFKIIMHMWILSKDHPPLVLLLTINCKLKDYYIIKILPQFLCKSIEINYNKLQKKLLNWLSKTIKITKYDLELVF